MKLTISGNLYLENLSPAEQKKHQQKNQWPNPARKQARQQGRQYFHIPKYVEAWEQPDDDTLILQRGYLGQVESEAAFIEDRRALKPSVFPELLGVALRDYQLKALGKVLNPEFLQSLKKGFSQGILEAPTGAGKTILGLSLIRERGQRAIILTHSKSLLNQWCDVIRKLMSVEPGQIGGGIWQEGELVTVAMLQTLNKRPAQARKSALGYGLVLVDECHHIPANTFSQVISWFPAFYRYGLTATPHRRDGLHDLIHRAIGPTIAKITPEEVQGSGGIVPAVVKVVPTNFYPEEFEGWSDFISLLIEDEDRNKQIAQLAERAAAKNHPVLVLTDRIDHVGLIAQHLESPCLQIHGNLKANERQDCMEQIHDHLITIGTTGLLGEGLDVSRWQALILATPISSKVRLLQAIGRVIRPHKGKTHGFVADLVDDHPISVSSFRKRNTIYQDRGFKVVNG